jgi:hypothetical protein
MAFLTTVKTTGELFDAATDLGADKNLSQGPASPARSDQVLRRSSLQRINTQSRDGAL